MIENRWNLFKDRYTCGNCRRPQMVVKCDHRKAARGAHEMPGLAALPRRIAITKRSQMPNALERQLRRRMRDVGRALPPSLLAHPENTMPAWRMHPLHNQPLVFRPSLIRSLILIPSKRRFFRNSIIAASASAGVIFRSAPPLLVSAFCWANDSSARLMISSGEASGRAASCSLSSFSLWAVSLIVLLITQCYAGMRGLAL
jgi:hypothetical protein